MNINNELSEENKKLIKEWDKKLKVKELKIILDNNKKIKDIEVGLKDSPFDYIAKGDLDLSLLPNLYLKLLSYVLEKIVKIIETNMNEKETSDE